jgi:hypothetical protein
MHFLVLVSKWLGFKMVGLVAIKWSKLDWKSTGQLISSLVFEWPFQNWTILYDFFSNGYNKMAAQNGPLLGYLVPAEIDHLKTRLVCFLDVY